MDSEKYSKEVEKFILTTPVLVANIAIYHQNGNTPYGVFLDYQEEKQQKPFRKAIINRTRKATQSSKG